MTHKFSKYPIEQLHKTLLEAIEDVVFVVDSHGRYQMFNEKGLESFGLKPRDVVGKTPREAFGDDVGKRFEANNNGVVQNKKTFASEEWFTLAGRHCCYSIVLSPILDERGEVLSLVGIGRDVTDLKQMTSNLEKVVEDRVEHEKIITELTQEAVKRQSLDEFLDVVVARLAKSFNVCRVFIFEYGALRKTIRTTHEWVDDRAKSFNGKYDNEPVGRQKWATDELLAGRSISFEDVSQIPDEQFRELMRSEGIKSILEVPIMAFGTPFGFLGLVECREGHRWQQNDTEFLRLVANIISQTVERRRLEDEILKMERLAATGRLAAGIAHEINNPLQGIGLHLDAINGHVEKAKLKNYNFIVEGFQRISKIVSRLLDVNSKVKKVEEVDINELLKDTLKLLQNQLSTKGCDVVWQLKDDLKKVYGDSGRLHQVFLNIALNSCDSMEKDGTLTIKTDEEGGCIIVEMTDTGSGIDEESLPFLFEPFFTTKGQSGTGLGLFVCHAIISDHDGKIDIASEKGAGTTVRVKLPALGTETCRGI